MPYTKKEGKSEKKRRKKLMPCLTSTMAMTAAAQHYIFLYSTKAHKKCVCVCV
jgi:hypothetical protein